MVFTADITSGVPVIRLRGPLDRRSSAMVRHQLNALALDGVEMAAIDLSEADRADEHGVELLAELSRRVVGEGWRWLVISLVTATVPAQRSFRLDQDRGRAFALVPANDCEPSVIGTGKL